MGQNTCKLPCQVKNSINDTHPGPQSESLITWDQGRCAVMTEGWRQIVWMGFNDS